MTLHRTYVMAAGGTGGHMMPAYALAAELVQRGHRVALVTDARGAAIPGLPDGVERHILPAGRGGGGVRALPAMLRAILKGRGQARRLYRDIRPAAVVGFGGYPAMPALLGAFAARVPTIIHEQNAVLGRVNRWTAGKVDAIATAYPDVQRLKPAHTGKTHLVGNPVRAEVLALRDEPYPPLDEEGVFRVLVTGGSQGATILSDVVPAALAMLPTHLRRRLQVTQQARTEDIERVRAAYAAGEIPAELATYLPDLPERLGWAHLVIGRAGASTIAELTVAGRPAVLVPLPSAMDDHQRYNVMEMVKAGGARSFAQDDFTAKALAKQIQKMALEPGALANAAKAAWRCGRPDAVRDLADLVEGFGGAGMARGLRAERGNAKPAAQPAFARRGAA